MDGTAGREQILNVYYSHYYGENKEYSSMFMLVGRFNFTSPKYGLKGMPEIFIGDKLGMIREKLIGPAERDIPENIQMLRKYINE